MEILVWASSLGDEEKKMHWLILNGLRLRSECGEFSKAQQGRDAGQIHMALVYEVRWLLGSMELFYRFSFSHVRFIIKGLPVSHNILSVSNVCIHCESVPLDF